MKNNKKMEQIKRRVSIMAVSFLLAACNLSVAFAKEADYAGNMKTWLSKQLGAIALIVLGAVLVGCLVKKNYIGAVSTVIGGGAITYFIMNPDQIKTIGEAVAGIFTGG